MKTIDYSQYQIRFLPNLPRQEPFVMDSTAYKVWADCRRKYFYRIVLGRVPLYGKYDYILQFGAAYHKFRELLETAGYAAAMKYVLTEVEISSPDPKSKFGFITLHRLIETCQKAFTHWEAEKKKKVIEVVAVEQPFNVEVVPGLFIGGRADQIVKFMGRLWGRDFKTTTKDKATFTRGLDPNDQAIRYIVGESTISGEPIQGIMFEAVYNSKETKAEIYTINTTRNQYQIENWKEEQALVRDDIERSRKLDIWSMDTGPDKKCSWCEYQKVCTMKSQGSMESMLRSEFKFAPWDHTKVDQEND